MNTRFILLLLVGGVLLAPALAHALLDYTVDWTETGTVGDGWGDAVCTAGDVNGDGYSDILVGAPDYTSGQISEGIVYLYYGSATGPSSSPDWSYASNVQFAQFGHAVSPAGDTNGDGYGDFLVGAPYVSAGHEEEGRVYLFAGGPGAPTLLQTFEMNEEEAAFGYTVAWAGDVNGDGYDDILAGAPEWGGFGSPFYIPVQGAARLYHGGPDGPDDTPDWSRSGGQEHADFGFCVAGVGDVNGDGYTDVLVGQPKYDPGIIDTDHGAAHLYLGSETGLASSPAWSFYGEGQGDLLGTAVAYAGDVNGDGYADATIGAPQYFTGNGALYFFSGSAANTLQYHERRTLGNDSAASLTCMGDFNGDGFADIMAGGGSDRSAHLFWGAPHGLSSGTAFVGNIVGYAEVVAGMGDVDGDGCDDFLFTSPYEHAGAGEIRLYLGGREVDFSPNESAAAAGTAVQSEFGRAMAGLGDVDGDGDEELLVGAPGTGEAHVFLGQPGGTGTLADQVIAGADPADRFGAAVAAAGDVNGDGHADAVIGEPGADRVHVYHGGPGGLDPAPAWSYQFAESGSDYGAAVAGAGDVNGDGYADVIVGAPLRADAGTERGLVHVFIGSPAGIVGQPFATLVMSWDNSLFGAAVAGIGDADGDGFDDVAIGCPGYDLSGLTDRGGVFVYMGGPDALSFTHEFVGTGVHDATGFAVAGAGDVDGDGFADLAIGDPGHDGQSYDSGRVRVYLGGETATFATNYSLTLETTVGGETFGRSLASLGEFDLSGRSALIVGSVVMPDELGTANVHILHEGVFHWVGGTPGVTLGTDCAVAGAGDTDGDGLPEVAIGEPAALGSYRGLVRVHGPVIRVGSHLPRSVPRAQHTGGQPLALRGLLPDPPDLEFAMDGWLPTGRTPYRLEWQVAADRDPFAGLNGGPWTAGSGQVYEAVPLAADPAVPLNEGTRCRWRVRVASRNPYLPHGPWLTDQPNTDGLYGFVVGSPITAVDDVGALPAAVSLLDAPYPNPFNPSTTLRFRLQTGDQARLRIFDVTGKLVRTLHDGFLAAGSYEMLWHGRNDQGRSVASGSYHAVLDSAGERHVQRLSLIK